MSNRMTQAEYLQAEGLAQQGTGLEGVFQIRQAQPSQPVQVTKNKPASPSSFSSVDKGAVMLVGGLTAGAALVGSMVVAQISSDLKERAISAHEVEVNQAINTLSTVQKQVCPRGE